MSHNPHETIICPNCGYHATYNYCAECGQETHLHKDTFVGLVGHFASHYFHYDSKFWKTMKLLWFHPGALTIAYWKKQRNRFIPPISLYIFISFVFFFCLSIFAVSPSHKLSVEQVQEERADSIKSAQLAVKMRIKDSLHRHTALHAVGKTLASAGQNMQELGHEGMESKEMGEHIMHMFPKMFFFMIPLMAFILKLLFFRRKDIYFVDHAVFSLHYHSFWFSAMLLTSIENFGSQLLSKTLAVISVSLTFIYLIAAIRKAYRTGWFKSVLYALGISVIYVIVFTVVFICSLVYISETTHI